MKTKEEKATDEILDILKKHDLDIIESKKLLNALIFAFDKQLIENCTE